ncbi:hypothetical protein BUALT_Bualt03G0163400 [Buddleja alternifolia]|uniref:EIF3F/CSN6-like C-terminal domain-containing protein n=1 Tax=Buddleja alternifolia TaxID=168488 RepID=A0AAV6XW07_9LAMI|nr:hypothetical protein BUALT_Bualt03G0163400 [Buddleja alternifolia]
MASSSSGLTFKLHPLVIVVSPITTLVSSPSPFLQRHRHLVFLSSYSAARRDLQQIAVIDGTPQLYFVLSSYTMETVEAERISVDHVVHLKPSDGGSAATQLAAHLTGTHSAIKMLNSRIRVLHHYLLAMRRDLPVIFLPFYPDGLY